LKELVAKIQMFVLKERCVMSKEQPVPNVLNLSRRHILSLAGKTTASLPFILGPDCAGAHDGKVRRWNWWRHDRRSLRHQSEKSNDKTEHHCFLRGTNVLTTKGEICVERISVGDLVNTVSGECLPVKWVGRQRFKKASRSNWPTNFLPVRIQRFALDNNTPHKDLYVSPGHALFIGGALIPAGYLINGSSVVQAVPDGMDAIEYFHIELETHEVIFAEGMPAETLLVKDGREIFDNFIEYERLYGDDVRSTMSPFAPIAAYNGGRSRLKALLRRLASPIIDIRDPVQVAYDTIAARPMEYV
jgi:hypothetical protein